MSGRLSVWALGLLCALVGGIVCAGVASANTLPDGRIYEQVTPKEKYGSDVYQPEVSLVTSGLGGTAYSEKQEAIAANSQNETVLTFQAAADGAGIAFAAGPTVGGDERQGKGGGNEYLAKRSSSGWTDSVLSPEGAPSSLFQAFSPDLSKGFVNSVEPLTPTAPGFGEPAAPFDSGYDVLYTTDTASGEYVPFFSTKPPYRSMDAFGTAGPFNSSEGAFTNKGARTGHKGYLALEGTSADDSHLLFAANDALTDASEGTPAAEGGSGSEFEEKNNLYDSVKGRLHLVNVLPDGTTHANAAFGGVEEPSFKEKRNVLGHAVSADGSRIFWTDLSTGRIYMRENDSQPQSASFEGHCTEPSKACTVQVSASEKTNGSGPAGADPNGPRKAQYQSASSDGSKVFFTSIEELTNDADTGASPTIARANLDGSAAQQSFIPAAAQAVAVDASHIYWSNASRGLIGRANLDGSGAEPEFITGASNPQGLAVDAAHLYWTNAAAGHEGEGSIGRANLDGTGVEQGFVTGASNPKALAIDGAHIYWANTGAREIGRASLDGSGAEQNFIGTGAEPQGIAVDSAHIYWTNAGEKAIVRANLDGTGVEQGFITGVSDPGAVAVDGAHVYWTSPATNALGRANLDGTGAEESFIAGATNPQGLAVNSAHLYWANNDSDREENLYRYEPGASEHLTDLTPGVNVTKVVGASENGEYVYYVTAANELVLWHDGASTPIANASIAQAEVTPDGHSIVFTVTEYVNQTQEHVEVYDADTGTLYCATCTSLGKLGMLPMTNQGNVYKPRWISADGSRVFFVTLEGLVSQDTNETQDVYEWERPGSGECAERGGCVYLLSGGTSPAHSGFLDASENGNDVFIVTRASLVGGDEDGLFDVYDVGVRTPPVTPPVCTGTGCQGVPNPTPIFATPSSVTFEGVGNFATPSKETKAKPKSKPKKKPKKKKGRKKSKAKKSARKADGRRRSSSKGGRS